MDDKKQIIAGSEVHNKAILLGLVALAQDPDKKMVGNITARDIVEIVKDYAEAKGVIIHG